MSLTKDEQKVLAATKAVDTLIERNILHSGCKIGLGTGSTALPAVKRLAEHIQNGTLSHIKAVATSFQTALLCENLEIPLYTLNDKAINGHLHLAIDGADEIGPQNTLIKGGGAALLREKIIAYHADFFAVVADESKAVLHHGTGFALPVEIVPEARRCVEQALCALGAQCVLREGVRKAGPVITDNGNMILDCLWKTAVDAKEMEDAINAITGVVENGFFTKHPAVTAFIAQANGTVEEKSA